MLCEKYPGCFWFCTIGYLMVAILTLPGKSMKIMDDYGVKHNFEGYLEGLAIHVWLSNIVLLAFVGYILHHFTIFYHN